MTDTREAFGDKVRFFRNRRHWKQDTLADRAKLSQSEISKIETGNLPRDPSKELIEKLANALEITPETLVSGTPLSSLYDGASTLRAESHEPPPPPERALSVERENRKVTRPERASGRKINDPFRICGMALNGKYELTEFAGSGGMGAVYRAVNLTNGEIVAVKILQPHILTRNPEYAELFEREAKNARSLDHPHIVKIFDSGKEEDLSYMVMEWVEGHSVEDILTQGQLPLDRLTNIFKQICSAVAFAHEWNIIHLDLKPGNILLLDRPEPDAFVKVIDFGLSRVISKESGTTVTKFRGTHQFCAPEQFGGKVSHRSDIYSLGATLYYLLTGVIPFGTSYINAKIHPNLELPEIPSIVRQRDLPPALDLVIKRALSKNPSSRQQSALQLFDEFHRAMYEQATADVTNSLFLTLRGIIIDELGVDEKEVVPTAKIVEDLGADENNRVEIILRLEKEFDIEIKDEEAETIFTVNDAYHYIQNKVATITYENNPVEEYKQNTDVDNTLRITRQIELTINMELSQFDKENQRWLQYAIAALLNIAPDNVRITSVEESNSIKVKVDVDLPKGAAPELFNDLNEETLSKLLNSSHILKAEKGNAIRPTSPNLYLVLDGYISLWTMDRRSEEENFSGWRGPGQICGEVMEIGTEPASVEPAGIIIIASSEYCVLLEIPNHVLVEVANDAPYLYRYIVKLLMQNMYQEQDRSRIIRAVPTIRQVAQTIIKLHRERGYDESGSGQVIKGNVFQHDIAGFIGIRRESVSRSMAHLNQKRLIDYHARKAKITILNLQGLESLATGSLKRKYD